MSNVISYQEAQNYKVNRPNQDEVIRQSIYDSQTYASAGQTSLTFFQIPLGQAGKTIADTNMKSAGVLPNPISQLVQSIELIFLPGVNPALAQEDVAITADQFVNDVYQFCKAGSLDFFIGSKSYLQEAPLGRFPPKTKLEVVGAAALTSEAATVGTNNIGVQVTYAAASGRPYFIDPAILLAPTQNFNVTLTWPSAVALPSGQNAKVFCVLDGLQYRLSQ